MSSFPMTSVLPKPFSAVCPVSTIFSALFNIVSGFPVISLKWKKGEKVLIGKTKLINLK